MKKPFNNLENKTSLDTYRRVQLVCMKIQAHSNSTTIIISGPDAFDESRFLLTFLTILEVTEILRSFRLVLEGKTSKEITESSRLEFIEKFLVNNSALSDADDNISGPLNRAGIADLPLLRTLLAIRDPTHCSGVPIVDFEQVNAKWVVSCDRLEKFYPHQKIIDLP